VESSVKDDQKDKNRNPDQFYHIRNKLFSKLF